MPLTPTVPDQLSEPDNWLPAAIENPLVLASNTKASVALCPILVYPSGILITVVSLIHKQPNPPIDFIQTQINLTDPNNPPPEFLKLQVELPHGTIVTNLHSEEENGAPPATLSPRGGEFTQRRADQRFWLSPIGNGNITVSCEWPTFNLNGTQVLPAKLLHRISKNTIKLPQG